MIPCPHCEREFEKRAGLMRHVTVSHPHEPYTGAPREVPVNPGGAIEPVVPVSCVDPETGIDYAPDISKLTDVEPVRGEDGKAAFFDHYVEPEAYAESLDKLAPGQEPYVDPPMVFDDLPGEPTEDQQQAMNAWYAENVARGNVAVGSVTVPDDLYQRKFAATPVRLTMDAPTTEQYKQIRAFIRSGRSESEAWMNVVGHEPPPRPPQPVDERPLRLQQVAFRVRNGGTDQIDARWLLQLAEIGAEAVAALNESTFIGGVSDGEVTHPEIIQRWNEAIR